MGKYIFKSKLKTIKIGGKETEIELLDNKEFDRFNPKLLGLGNIRLRSETIEAIASIFDLSGFTNFCSQVDPHLSVLEYLSKFLGWLFDEIKEVFVEKSYPEGKKLWAELPFLAKFLGDGVLFLWDCENMNEVGICNVVVSLKDICDDYRDEFYPQIKKDVVETPNILRCGIARGRVFSVGNGNDYVGPCINIASRLQKFSSLTFCFSRRGFDIEKYMGKEMRSEFVEKSILMRGIGKDYIWILKEEFEKLPETEKKLFRNP